MLHGTFPNYFHASAENLRLMRTSTTTAHLWGLYISQQHVGGATLVGYCFSGKVVALPHSHSSTMTGRGKGLGKGGAKRQHLHYNCAPLGSIYKPTTCWGSHTRRLLLQREGRRTTTLAFIHHDWPWQGRQGTGKGRRQASP